MRAIRTVIVLVAAAIPALLSAQECRPGAGSNEGKLLAYYAVPFAFSPSGALAPLPPGAVRVSFDATWIPAPDAELRRTSRCFLPKEEHTQLSPVLPRPRVAIGLPAGLVFEATWLPPVTVADATPNMVSAALSLVRPVTPRVGVAVRVHATLGDVSGPITCPESALQQGDAGMACFGTSPSDDTYEPNVAGVETALTWQGGGRLAGYAGVGYSNLRPRFQVGFQEGDGDYDSTRVVVDLTRLSAMAGLCWSLARGMAITSELYAVPEDLVVLRVGGSLRLR